MQRSAEVWKPLTSDLNLVFRGAWVIRLPLRRIYPLDIQVACTPVITIAGL